MNHSFFCNIGKINIKSFELLKNLIGHAVVKNTSSGISNPAVPRSPLIIAELLRLIDCKALFHAVIDNIVKLRLYSVFFRILVADVSV